MLLCDDQYSILLTTYNNMEKQLLSNEKYTMI